MKEWFLGLSALEQVYFWLGIVSTVFLIVQIILMCCSSFGGDVDLDGDGDIDVDMDSGVSIFTVKSITAFFAMGSWTGLFMCAVAPNIKWLSVIIAIIVGGIAMAVVVVALKALTKLQCNGAVQIDKLIGQRATVYVSVPPSRSGRGKITITAQGRYMELDAITDSEERLAVDEAVEIVATENECTVVKKVINENKGEE